MKWFRKKKVIIPLGVLLILVALRVVLQPFLLSYINEKLANFSPAIEGHVDGLSIKILRGAFGLENLTMKLKKEDQRFLLVKEADISLAWREIFKGNLITDAMVDGVTFTYDERLPAALKESTPPVDKDAPKEQPPLRIARLDWKNVNIIFPTDKAYTNQGPFKLTAIEGRMTNLFADEETPRSFFHLQGKGSGTSTFKAVGSANLLADPLEWDVDAQMLGFTLSSMNRFLLNKVPLSFTKGNFDLYAEVKSEEGKIRGYIKPFMRGLDFMKTDENFKGARHWLVELAGAVGNWLMEAKRNDSVATKVPFSYDGKKFSVNSRAAVGNIIEHGFDQELSPGVDGNMTMQAQEAEDEAKETEKDNQEKVKVKE